MWSFWRWENPCGASTTPAPMRKPLCPCLPQTFTDFGKVSGPPSLPVFISEEGSDGRQCGTQT